MKLALEIVGLIALLLYIARTIDLWWGEYDRLKKWPW